MNSRTLLEGAPFDLTIERLCYQLIENHGDFAQSCIIGVQVRGAVFAERLHQTLCAILPDTPIAFGKLDVTFHRDDYRMHAQPLQAHSTNLDFLLDGKRVILIDDVLYSGRTTRAALDALQDYGRPAQIEFLCLVDRRFNRQLPIRPDYVGMTVDAVNEAYVKVEWATSDAPDKVVFYEQK
jgi:pyrimidine operon attenuation protein / uracil phosphoribosyltransferase